MDGHYEEEEEAAAAEVEVLSGEEEKEEGDDDSDESGSNNSSDDDDDDGDDFSSYDLTDRDQVLLAVRDECTDDEEYGLLMKFCRKHLRSTYAFDIYGEVVKGTDYKLSFIDGIILVLLYVRIGLDLNARYDDFCWEDLMDGCTTDKYGRIVSLDIDPSCIHIDAEAEDYEGYNLPRVVVLLQSLTHLKVRDCRSLYDNDYLSLLPHLEEIEFYFARIHLSQVGLPLGTNPIPQVKHIFFCFCAWSGSVDLSESDFFAWLKSKFPNLKALETLNNGYEVDDHDRFAERFVGALLRSDVCFQDKLERLGVSVDGISPNGDTPIFETILNSGLLSKFKNLQRIDLCSNGIRNFNSIAVTSTTSLLPRTLHTVDLSCNPIMKAPSNQMALMKYLETNSGIYNLGVGWLNDYHPDIKYVLLINCARRSFIDHNSTVLPSLLPKFLEQVYNKSDDIYAKGSKLRGKKDSTGVYHLLRQNLPAVISSRLYPSSTGVKRKPEQRRLSKRKVRK